MDLIKVILPRVENKIASNDPSHDIGHTKRVLGIALKIAESEDVDLDVLIPACLFHDAVVYNKNTSESKNETEESAEFAEEILSAVEGYSNKKINRVKSAILECSFSKQIVPKTIESKILQDADRLEATGAVSIMRTFSSGGQMGIPLMNLEDPFCENRDPKNFSNSLDLFYNRLLKVHETLHTESAKKISRRRTDFLESLLEELRKELDESDLRAYR